MSNKDMTPVLNTDYKEYFESAGAKNAYLLSKSKANDCWDEATESKVSSFFKLPDDNWIIRNESAIIGEWISSYNDDDAKPVSDMLNKNISWGGASIIKFLVNRDVAFQVPWENFIEMWDDFIAIEDDCPLVIPSNPKRDGLLIFRPIGDIRRVLAST